MINLIPNFEVINSKFLRQLRTGVEELGNYSSAILYLSSWDFDEDWYLYKYPDIAQAIDNNAFPTAREHFYRVGYYEGRLPVELKIDEDWYVDHYPDVAKSLIDGTLKSPLKHFREHGYREGRLPANPNIILDWYGPRYMSDSLEVDETCCLRHYVDIGYLNGALARAP